MQRRNFLKTAAVMAGAAAFPDFLQAAEKNNKNVLIIVCDDLGAHDLGCYGNTLHETPNLDRLARQGMRFTQGYASCAVCSPTRASLQTGKYPARLGITDWIPGVPINKIKNRFDPEMEIIRTEKQLELEEVTIADYFKAKGYSTAFLGKWHLGETEKYYPKNQGYDTNFAGTRKGAPYAPNHYYAPYNNPKIKPEGEKGEYLTDRIGDESAKRLAELCEGEKPFYMLTCFYTVHTPIKPRKDLEEYYRKKLEARPNKIWDNPSYAAMVHCMDVNCGKILDVLKDKGLEDDTIVIFTSDNGGLTAHKKGPTSNYPLRSGKGFYYEGGIREPYLFRVPGVTRPGSECGYPIITNDIFPTVIEATGGQLLPQLHKDGLSLMPLLSGKKDRLAREDLFWHFPHYHGEGERPCSTVRSGDYKLIRHYEGPTLELYNLREDISEKNDLSEKMPEKVKQLEQKLDNWLEKMNAKIPEKI
ncbi:Arylsulfatase [Sedimentisphaera cyanobacteriorum]|uniref:Arylsulfatase n=1 Tax=Sedimentisphaera cyanobacteriorum TaxID=1940790 RepID=A0A1Q2HS23_9BACT|nr:sulfatase [Sedimentisphaera cyanobacteriorum]AQQ10035.1 Arylsulfatase [Sedimentisphaera cyanobacteriorum]